MSPWMAIEDIGSGPWRCNRPHSRVTGQNRRLDQHCGTKRNRPSLATYPETKTAPKGAVFNPYLPGGLRRLGFRLLHRTGVLALGIDVAIDEFDHGHRGVVAVAEAGLDDAGVAALAVLVAGRQNVEQLLDLILVCLLYTSDAADE